MRPAAALLQSLAGIPNTRVMFLVSVVTVLAVVGFASATIWIMLRRSYARRLEEQKLAMMGTVTARILHQLKNPLQSLILQAELLQEFERSDSRDLRIESATSIASEAHRLATMLNELSVWASGARRSLSPEPTAIHELIADFARRGTYEAERVGIEFTSVIRAEAIADVDAYFLQQAIDNLARNAQEALRGCEDPALRIELDRTDSEVLIRIIDNGPGIPADRLDEVFEPFVSGKTAGMGLGLPITREIVEAHGGEVRVDSEVGIGTTFTVALPLLSDNARLPDGATL